MAKPGRNAAGRVETFMIDVVWCSGNLFVVDSLKNYVIMNEILWSEVHIKKFT